MDQCATCYGLIPMVSIIFFRLSLATLESCVRQEYHATQNLTRIFAGC
jgi:hypothetical protein